METRETLEFSSRLKLQATGLYCTYYIEERIGEGSDTCHFTVYMIDHETYDYSDIRLFETLQQAICYCERLELPHVLAAEQGRDVSSILEELEEVD